MKDSELKQQFTEAERTCPRCGGAMHLGHVAAFRAPIWWVALGQRVPRTVFGGERLVGYWSKAVLPAARCRRCGIGLFRYEP